MKIHKVKTYQYKGDQLVHMVLDCRDYLLELNDSNFSHYTDIMNMKTRRWNDELNCYVTLTYHLEPKKW